MSFDSLLWPMILVSSAAIVMVWLILFIVNPRDYLGIRENIKGHTEFDSVSVAKIRNLIERLQRVRILLTTISEPGFPFAEAMEIGKKLDSIGHDLSCQDLQVERFVGWMLFQVGNRIRRVGVTKAGIPTLSSHVLDVLVDYLNTLLTGIEKRNVILCYQTLNNLLFLVATGSQPISSGSNRLEGFRQSFKKELAVLHKGIGEQGGQGRLIQFKEKWGEPTKQIGDAEIYCFLETLEWFEDQIYSTILSGSNSDLSSLTFAMKVWIESFARGLRDHDTVIRYRSIAKVVTHIILIRTRGEPIKDELLRVVSTDFIPAHRS